MLLAIWLVGGTMCGGLALWGLRAARTGRRHAALAERSEALGLREPPSLHPVINEHVCICTGACVTVCPEKDFKS